MQSSDTATPTASRAGAARAAAAQATAARAAAAGGRAAGATAAWVGVALLVSAFNLRPALASAGALLDELRHGLGMGTEVAGLLTALPSACFALAGALAPRLIRRHGPAAVISVALLVLCAGLLGRAIASGAGLFLLWSALAIAGIGVGNVVMPAAVRTYFPDRVGLLTGLYSTALTIGAALAAAVSVPVAGAFAGGWRTGVGVWAAPAAIGAAAWLVPALRARRAARQAAVAPGPAVVAGPAVADPAGAVAAGPAVVAGPGLAEAAPAQLWRSRAAWRLTVFFGLQAAGAYIVLGWLPQLLRDARVSSDTAGLLLALTPTVGIPFALVLPSLAARSAHPARLVVLLSAVGLLGYAGLGLAPAGAPWLWAGLLGVSQASFPLALIMIGLTGGSPGEVARLSAFVQGFGYLLATPCPFVISLLYQHTHAWHLPLLFMIALLIPQTLAGVAAAAALPHRRSGSNRSRRPTSISIPRGQHA